MRALLGKSSSGTSSKDAPASKIPAPPPLPNMKPTSQRPVPLQVRSAPAGAATRPDQVAPASPNTIAIRVEEIRSIAREVAARESEAKKAERLHAVAVPAHRGTTDESAVVLGRMFPHLVRQSPLTIAVRVVFFVAYVLAAIGSVLLRALRHLPRLAVQARDGLRDAWIRTAFRGSQTPRV